MYYALEEHPDHKFDWLYKMSRNNRSYLGIDKDEAVLLSSGKMLGGTSGINGMVYFRGNSRDFDAWEAMGNPSWAWTDVRQYFEKAENQLIVGNRNQKTHRFAAIMAKACQEMGIQTDAFIGFSKAQFTIGHGERSSSAAAYLCPAKDRANLHVIKRAHVTRLLMVNGLTVEGVEFSINGTKRQAFARKEVVSSAGVIGTPQLLLQSGIGPRRHLEEMGIKCVADLKVGNNLQDHFCVPMFYRVQPAVEFKEDDSDEMDNFYKYLTRRTGPMSENGFIDMHGFFNSLNESDPFPDIQVYLYYLPKNSADKVREFLVGYRSEVIESALEANRDRDLGIIMVFGLNLRSVGTVRLNTGHTAEPQIDPNYLSDEMDVRSLVDGMQYVRQFERTVVFRKLLEFFPLQLSDCGSFDADEIGYFRCYVRHLAMTGYHLVGTAKMGHDNDAVVDARLKVRGGVRGLRVVDASVMPKLISGNTNAATIMIGEKGSDFIKEDWMRRH